jgi:hypothetical protein
MAANAADKQRVFEKNRVIDGARTKSLLMGLTLVVGAVEQSLSQPAYQRATAAARSP